MNTRTKTYRILGFLTSAATALILVGVGCSSDTCTEARSPGMVNVAVAVGGWAEAVHTVLKAGPVPLEDIESFLITIDRITLHVTSEDDSLEGVVVFDASLQPAEENEIDLVDLSKLSEIVSSAEVPSGDYGQVRMEISDPRLRLVGDPAEEYRTNVKRTANGRLFAGVELTILPGQTLDLNLVLNDLHLVEKGNGDFVLTPQLRVDIVSGD